MSFKGKKRSPFWPVTPPIWLLISTPNWERETGYEVRQTQQAFPRTPFKEEHGGNEKVPLVVPLPEHLWAICMISVVENLFQSAAVPEKCPIDSRNHFERRDMKFKNSHMNNHCKRMCGNHCKRMCGQPHYDTKREFAPPRWGHMFWWALTA